MADYGVVMEGQKAMIGNLSDMLRVREAGSLLGASHDQVRALAASGAFPGAIKVGLGPKSHYRIPRRDVLAFMEANRVKGGAA